MPSASASCRDRGTLYLATLTSDDSVIVAPRGQARLQVARLALLALALAALSCASTRNFTDPAGPRYDGRFSHSTDGNAAPAPTAPLLVVTFNIEHAREIDRALGVLRGNAALRNPDLLLLQEMDGPGVQRIARELRLNYVYFPSAVHPRSRREFGTAILSPWFLEDARKIVLPYPSLGTGLRRSVAVALMRRADLRVQAYSVHLPAPGSINIDQRKEQVRIILEDAAKAADPVVIAGDFNRRVVGRWFGDSGYLWLTDRLPGTVRGLGRLWSFDHVFVRGLRPTDGGPTAGVVNPAGSSDHRAVWARVEPR